MTDTTTTLAPTDAEIEELLKSCGMSWVERSFWQLEDADLHPAIRAVLAKWGSPATASGEPVALRYRMHGDLQWQYTENPDQASHADVIQRLATTAQEARVPLSSQECRGMLEEVDPYNFAIDLIRAVEKHHGITAALLHRRKHHAERG